MLQHKETANTYVTLRTLHINSERNAFYTSTNFHNTAILSTCFSSFYQESTLVLKYFTDSKSKSFCVRITRQSWFVLPVLSTPRTKGSNCIPAYKGAPVAEHTIVSFTVSSVLDDLLSQAFYHNNW